MRCQVRMQHTFRVVETSKGFVGPPQRIPESIDAYSDLQIGERNLVISARGNPFPPQAFMLDAKHG